MAEIRLQQRQVDERYSVVAVKIAWEEIDEAGRTAEFKTWSPAGLQIPILRAGLNVDDRQRVANFLIFSPLFASALLESRIVEGVRRRDFASVFD